MAIVVGDDEIPTWATLDMSAEHCYTMLREEFKLDEDAVQDMFLLAQHSYTNMVRCVRAKKGQHQEAQRHDAAEAEGDSEEEAHGDFIVVVREEDDEGDSEEEAL